MTIAYLVAIDLAKNSFHIHGTTESGRRVISKRVPRSRLFETVVKLKPTVVAFEACGSSHYWGRRFSDAGAEIRMIPAQHVKPFVKTNKSDRTDAEAIAVAAIFPTTQFVPLKTLWQQDMQSLHKERERLVANRTSLCNQLRAILSERGEIAPQGRHKIILRAASIVSEENTGFVSAYCKRTIMRMLSEYRAIDGQIKDTESQIEEMSRDQPEVQRLKKIPGIGPLTASALSAAVGDKSQFRNGRHLAAWLGLVPKHTGTGGKTRLLGVSKRGNSSLRRLFIQGASASLRCADRRDDRVSRWVSEVKKRCGVNKAKVALANKTARIAFRVLCKGEEYRTTA